MPTCRWRSRSSPTWCAGRFCAQSDLEPERNVILEEISGVADTPDDLVFELHAETLWPEHPYGYSILGTPESLGALSAEDLKVLHRGGYYRGNCVIAAAGHVNHDQLLTVLEREGWFEGSAPGAAPRAAVTPAPAVRGASHAEERDTAQTHIVFGTDTFPLRDPRRFPLAILTNVFGGGMSSRLFQRVREELGLAYAIFAYKHFYQGSGSWASTWAPSRGLGRQGGRRDPAEYAGWRERASRSPSWPTGSSSSKAR